MYREKGPYSLFYMAICIVTPAMILEVYLKDILSCVLNMLTILCGGTAHHRKELKYSKWSPTDTVNKHRFTP